MKKQLLNCWELPKPVLLQRKDEICLNVNAAKAERKYGMLHGQILNSDERTTSSQALIRGRFNDQSGSS